MCSEKKEIKKNIIQKEKKIVNINKKKYASFDTLDEVLSMHNKYRIKHGCKPLSISKELCNLAQKYAKECAKNKNIEHYNDLYKDDIIGQNISVIDCYSFDVEKICKSWYHEKEEYKFGSNKYTEGAGHFTQLIWKKTAFVGIAYEKDDNGKIYFVAYYYPAGNIFN